MKGTSMGCETSHSRVNVKPTTKEPPASKVTANSAHGANMTPRSGNRPDGWATFGHGTGTAKGMRSEEYGKSGKTQTKPTANMNPKGPSPKRL